MRIIKIGAVWCNACLVMKPRWAEIEKENPWLSTSYYDYDQDQDQIKKYHVDEGVVPVFIFLDKKGKEIERLSGEIKKDKLLQVIDQLKNK